MTSVDTTSASTGPVTVAWLVQRNVALRWQEAVALVLEIADVFARSEQPHLPPYQDLALTPDGTIRFLQEPTHQGDPLTTLIDILRAVLPTDSPTSVWIIASSAGLESRSYGSVGRVTAALRDLERPGRREMLTQLYRRALERALQADGAAPPSFQPAAETSAPSRATQMLPLDQIRVRHPSRSDVSPSLVEIVKKHGALLPVLVRPRQRGYELISGAKWFEAARAAGLNLVLCHVCDLDDDDVQLLEALDRTETPHQPARSTDSLAILEPTLTEIADSLNAAASCWRLSTEETDRPYHATVSQVTKVELHRATSLVEGLRILTQPPVLNKMNRNLGMILERVFRSTKPERRLNNVRLLANLSETSVMLSVDEQLAVLAYGGMVQAILALVRRSTPAIIRCEVSTKQLAATVSISQDVVAVPDSLMNRFFDESFHTRPGGYGTAVGLAVTKSVMDLHGGTVTVESVDPVGCRVTAHLPLGHQ